MTRAEALVADLGLTHRVIDICTGDMGIAHHRSWDLEVWSPGLGQWLEASSVSWLSDYQARRANLRYRPTEGKGTELLHTLNGSGLAVPRVLAALLEVEPISVSRLVDRMAEAGWIERRQDTTDRRVRTIHPTDKSRAVFAEVKLLAAERYGEALAGRSPEIRRATSGGLAAIVDNLSAGDACTDAANASKDAAA